MVKVKEKCEVPTMAFSREMSRHRDEAKEMFSKVHETNLMEFGDRESSALPYGGEPSQIHQRCSVLWRNILLCYCRRSLLWKPPSKGEGGVRDTFLTGSLEMTKQKV
jgi:hypothetical protein